MILLPRAAYRRSAWKNGGGVTREIIRVPAEGDFEWRLSVAEIAQSGPFSDFSGYSRTMVLLAGDGLTLRASGGVSEGLTTPGDLIQFDGAVHMHCDLADGPCTDLNLMVADAAGAISARVQSVQKSFSVQDSLQQTRIVFVVNETVALADSSGNHLMLSTWDTAVCTALDGEVICSSDTASARVFIATF